MSWSKQTELFSLFIDSRTYNTGVYIVLRSCYHSCPAWCMRAYCVCSIVCVCVCVCVCVLVYEKLFRSLLFCALREWWVCPWMHTMTNSQFTTIFANKLMTIV